MSQFNLLTGVGATGTKSEDFFNQPVLSKGNTRSPENNETVIWKEPSESSEVGGNSDFISNKLRLARNSSNEPQSSDNKSLNEKASGKNSTSKTNDILSNKTKLGGWSRSIHGVQELRKPFEGSKHRSYMLKNFKEELTNRGYVDEGVSGGNIEIEGEKSNDERFISSNNSRVIAQVSSNAVLHCRTTSTTGGLVRTFSVLMINNHHLTKNYITRKGTLFQEKTTTNVI